MAPTPDDVRRAAERIAAFAHRTPVLRSHLVDAWAGCEVFCKAEHLQRGGAFKFRGATNAVAQLDDTTARRGVAAHSSGNHATALALAAAARGIPCTIVMPSDAPAVKRASVEAAGAVVVSCEPSETARIETLRTVLERTGAVEIHPYDDDAVIAGAGTAVLELLDEVPDLDAVVVPIGGGGLASGSCLAAAPLGVPVYAAEPTGADDAARSLATGSIVRQTSPDTICDGLRTSLAPRTFAVLQEHLAAVLLVDDNATAAALELVVTRMKQWVEPSGVIGLAGVRTHDAFVGARVGIVFSGGNLDPGRLASLLTARA